MREHHERFKELGAEILSTGPENGAIFRAFWKRYDIPFTGLPDPKHVVAKLYQQPVRLLRLGRMPMTLVIDREGVIRYHYVGDSMRDIPTCQTVLSELSSLPEA